MTYNTFMDTTTPVTHTYYVGDLAYVLDTDQWDTVCWHDFGLCPIDGDYDPEGFLDPEAFSWEDPQAAKPFYNFSTAYGDGCYSGSDGQLYCVDSGTIGCIRTDYADPEKLADAVARGLGHLHEFHEEFCGYGYCGEDDGLIWFDTATGLVEIQTGGGWDDEEEEEDTEEEVDTEEGDG